MNISVKMSSAIYHVFFNDSDIFKQQATNILGLDLYYDIMNVENEKENNNE